MAELLTRIMSMDPREAHRQMCLAQDEVARLQRQARQEPTNEAESGGAAETDGEESNKARPQHARGAAAAASAEVVPDPSPGDDGTRTSNGGAARSSRPTSTRKQRCDDRNITAGGTWLVTLGERLCAEFLTNVGSSASATYVDGSVVRIGAVRFKYREWPFYLWCSIPSFHPSLQPGIRAEAWENAPRVHRITEIKRSIFWEKLLTAI